MKRQFLLWLDSFYHKPKWLRKKIEMAYWADVLNVQEEKKKAQTEYDKKLEKLEEKIMTKVNTLRRTLLSGYGDGGVIMTKLTPEEANKKMISILEEDGYKPEEIPERLRALGFKVEEKPLKEPKQKPETIILKEVSRTEEKKPKRRTTNGRRKTTAKATA